MEQKEKGFVDMAVEALQRYAETDEAAFLEVAHTALTWLRQHHAQKQLIVTSDPDGDMEMLRALTSSAIVAKAGAEPAAPTPPVARIERKPLPSLRQTRPVGHHAVLEPGLCDPAEMKEAKDLRNALNRLDDGGSVYLTARQAQLFDRGAVHWQPNVSAAHGIKRGRRLPAED